MKKETYNYEEVLGDIAFYIADKCNLTPSEAVGIVMNADCTDKVVEEINHSSSIDVKSLANLYLCDEIL